jgi:aspartyl-tRNA(Asn)/glutamyl-tRNA(Gln) amidotransferase subunit A
MSLNQYSIKEVENMLQTKKISAAELTDMSLAQIKSVDDDVKAFLTVTEDEAKRQAKIIDEA